MIRKIVLLAILASTSSLPAAECAEQSADRLKVGQHIIVGFFVHLHCLSPYGDGLACSTVDGNDRRLVYDDFVFVNNEGICGAEVNRQLLFEEIKPLH